MQPVRQVGLLKNLQKFDFRQLISVVASYFYASAAKGLGFTVRAARDPPSLYLVLSVRETACIHLIILATLGG